MRPELPGAADAEQTGAPRSTWVEWKAGAADIWQVGLGLIPLGLAFGMVITQAGFAWWWAPIFSVVVYAGSMEYLAVTLVTSAASPLSAALAGFLVNFRHLFYGITHPRDRIRSRCGRAYATYSLTDEVYAVVGAMPPEQRHHLSGARLVAIHAWCQLLWVLPGVAGALFGVAIPPEVRGMEFALVALFAVLAVESYTNNPDPSLVLTAGVLGLLGAIFMPAHMLVVALTIYLAMLVLRYRLPRVDQALSTHSRKLFYRNRKGGSR